MTEPPFDAVVLAGGRGSRLGGVTKADLVVGGERLLDRVLAAAADAATRVVVGAVEVPGDVVLTCEDPPGTGPAAGLVAGLAAIASPAAWTLVLACDLPGADAAVPALLGVLPGVASDRDGVCLATPDGQPQWLLGAYRSERLRAAASAYGDPRNRSVRGMLRGLALATVPDPSGVGDDLDTWADHARWTARLGKMAAMSEERPAEDRAQWQPFVDRVCAALGLDPARVDIDAILDMTREIAHAGARPMAPVSAYLLGLAVGRQPQTSPEFLRRVVEDAATAAPVPPDA